MTLVGTFNAAGATALQLAVDELTFERTVGSAVRLSLVADVQHTEDVKLAEMLQTGPVTVKVAWDGSGINVKDRQVVPASTIVAARWTEGDTRKVEIEALHTQLRAPADDLLTPKWRVHRKDSLGALIRAFPDVARMTEGVAYQLDQIKLPLAEHACIVQAGISDWELVNEALRRYRLHRPDAKAKNILLTGSVDERGGACGGWIATFTDRDAYEEQNDIAQRVIRTPSDVTDVTYAFGSLRASDLCLGTPLGRMMEVVRSYLNSSMSEWTSWRSRDLPLFTEETRMVWRVRDRLIQTGDNLEWRTAVHVVPDGSAVPAPSRPRRVESWTGIGTVKDASPAGPWATVTLPEPFAKGENEIDARLTTIYAGADGKTGLHLVPEKDSLVLLHWPGGFSDPVLLLGNVRTEAAKIEAPSLSLEKALALSLQEVTVQTVGAITAESAVDVSVEKTTSLKSKGSIKIVGEQAKAEFSGARFNVGQAG